MEKKYKVFYQIFLLFIHSFSIYLACLLPSDLREYNTTGFLKVQFKWAMGSNNITCKIQWRTSFPPVTGFETPWLPPTPGLVEFTAPASSRFHHIWMNIVFRETVIHLFPCKRSLKKLCGKLQTNAFPLIFMLQQRTRLGQLPVQSRRALCSEGAHAWFSSLLSESWNP